MLPITSFLSCPDPIDEFECFSNRQKHHAKTYVTGLVAASNKTVDGIATHVLPSRSERALIFDSAESSYSEVIESTFKPNHMVLSSMANRLADAYIPDVVPQKDFQYFKRGGHGERIGWGDSPTIIVVDMTDEFISERSKAGERAAEANERVLTAARETNLPVVFTKPDRRLPNGYRGTTKPKAGLMPNRSGTNEIHSTLGPAEGEHVLEKPRASGFFDTHLANMLHEFGTDTVVVTGISTSGCVRATVVDAHSSNFNVIVPQEATADRSQISHEVSLFDIDMKYGDVTTTGNVVERLHDYRK